MYAEFEEKHGLLNHCFEIYERMISSVDSIKQKFAFKLYISKVSEHMGITKTRSLYEKALTSLEEDDIITIGLEYASVEKRIGEIDRAREVFVYLSQYCEPDLETFNFWAVG